MLNTKKIGALIKAKKMKSTILADQIFGNKGKRSIVKYLEGHPGVTFEKVEQIADALGVPVDCLRSTTYPEPDDSSFLLQEEIPEELYSTKKAVSMKNNEKRFKQFIKFVDNYVNELQEENEYLRRQLNIK